MVINNHRRIDQLENRLESERERVQFLEDLSGKLNIKVGHLEKSMLNIKKEIGGQSKSLMTILSLVKLISNHQISRNESKLKRWASSIAQNALIFGLIQLLMRITWLDAMIDGLLGLLKFGDVLSRKTIEMSKFLAKLAISLSLFVFLRGRIKLLLEKLRNTVSFLL